MYAKSFTALDGNQHLTGAATAQIFPYDYYSGSALVFHPEWISNLPWFGHTWEDLTENGRHHCPYVRPEPKEARRVRMLRRYVPDVLPIVRKTNWRCSGCNSDYHGERYYLNCHTGGYSIEVINSGVNNMRTTTRGAYSWVIVPSGAGVRP